MCAVKFAVFAAATLAAFNLADTYVSPSGKCDTSKCQPISIKYSTNADLINWIVIYATEADPYAEMDYFLVQMTANGDDSYNETDTITYTNSSSETENYKQTYLDNVIMQDSREPSETSYHFQLYPLDITSDNAVLYYRCSESSDMSVDTRFIAIPKGGSLSDEGLKQLMHTDAKCGFNGNLFKLPYSQYSST